MHDPVRGTRHGFKAEVFNIGVEAVDQSRRQGPIVEPPDHQGRQADRQHLMRQIKRRSGGVVRAGRAQRRGPIQIAAAAPGERELTATLGLVLEGMKYPRHVEEPGRVGKAQRAHGCQPPRQ